ncbi:MAG: AgmX/PglI C-terminal domain-containing protein [Candidatus Latescibacterota bacterium]
MGTRAWVGGRLAAACLLWLLALPGCSLLFPPRSERTSLLVPQPAQVGAEYEVRGSRVTYVTEGLRLEVEPLGDRELNQLFGDESAQGRYSTNPYTFGDQVDRAVGYVPSRFTVFRVTVHNLSLPRVELRPERSLLTTSRPGEELPAYGVQAGSAGRTFEAYYKALRGASGNGEYLYGMRMANVRSTLYPSREPVLRGESRQGLVVFDPLADEVKGAVLHVRDFVLRINAYGKPLQSLDLAFRFDRESALAPYREETVTAAATEKTRARLAGTSRVTGQAPGDLTREVPTIDAYVRARQDELNRCFGSAFAGGQASPGSVTLQYVILPHGGIERVEVTASSIDSPGVEECLAEGVRRWRFPPSTGAPPAPAAADSAGMPAPALAPAPSGPVLVTSTIEFGEAGLDR